MTPIRTDVTVLGSYGCVDSCRSCQQLLLSVDEGVELFCTSMFRIGYIGTADDVVCSN